MLVQPLSAGPPGVFKPSRARNLRALAHAAAPRRITRAWMVRAARDRLWASCTQTLDCLYRRSSYLFTGVTFVGEVMPFARSRRRPVARDGHLAVRASS
jgi:hypothetical protein